jgi:hypothetical protein
MGIGSMLKMALSPTPRWIKGVEQNGQPALATVLSDPKEIIEGVAGYRAKNGWTDFEADVQTEVGERFAATTKCRLSQALAGRMEPGMKVNVRYDPDDRERVVLVDDVQTLLNYRLKLQ